MLKFFQDKSKFLILVFLTAVFVSCFTSVAKAYLLPQVFVTQLQASAAASGQIKGQFTIWNYENTYISGLNYEIKLFQGADFNTMKLADVTVAKNTFSVAPGQKIVQPFVYQYPKNIAKGDYTLIVQVMDGRGDELGFKDQILSLTGTGKFLNEDTSSAKLLVNGKQFPPLQGALVSTNGQVKAVFNLQNPGNAITVVPKISIFNRQINMPVAQQYNGAQISLAKGETKEVSLNMPSLKDPESYLAEVRFYSNQEQVSGIVYFRWVVEGEGGKILDIETDTDSAKAGGSINITVTSVGPADQSNLGTGTLEVTIYDQNGNVVGQASKDIALNPDVTSTTLTVPVKNDLASPKIEAKLAKGQNTLDQRSVILPVFSSQAKTIEQAIEQKNEANFRTFLIYLISAILLLVIIIVIAVFLLKLKSLPPHHNE